MSFRCWGIDKSAVMKAIALLLLVIAPSLQASTTVHFLGPWSKGSYFSDLLQLSLEKTKDDFGAFQIQPHADMNNLRAMTSVGNEKYPNPIVASSVDAQVLAFDDFAFIDFPVFLGMLGYRVCFVPESDAARIQPKSLEQLRHFKMGLVKTWPDLDVLQHNQIQLEFAPTKQSLYLMTSRSRVDVFCRGIIEISPEEPLRRGVDNLTLDTSFAMYYDLPFFFYTHKDNDALIKRIETGLLRAYKDGSLKLIWERYFRESINLIKFENRKLIVLDNPNMALDGKQYNFRKYFYKPKLK